MNTIDITNSLEKDKLVNTEQSQLTDTITASWHFVRFAF